MRKGKTRDETKKKKKKWQRGKNRQKLRNERVKRGMYRKQTGNKGWLYQQRNVFPADIV